METEPYTWMTRAETKECVRSLLIGAGLLGCLSFGFGFGTPGLVWLGRVVFVLIALTGIKRRDTFLVVWATPFLIATFIADTFAMMWGFLWFGFGGLGFLGYALLTPLTHLLKNFLLWCRYK